MNNINGVVNFPEKLSGVVNSPEKLSGNVGASVVNTGSGATFFPYVSTNGVISWTNDKGLENPEPRNIKGPKGADGKTPVKGTDYFTEDDKDEIIAEVVAELPSGGGGGPVSWNDLTDKPFGEKLSGIEIVSNLTTEDYNSGNYPPCNFVEGEKYTVIWNGEEYRDLICYSDGFANYIGGDGYPFYIDDNGGIDLYIDDGGSGNYTVTIIGDQYTTLSKKYLPENYITPPVFISGVESVYQYIDSVGNALEEFRGEVQEKLEDIEVGGDVSWNDLTDKPFGTSETSWALVASGTAANSAKSIELVYGVVGGKNYKLEVQQLLTNMPLTSNVAPATTGSLGWYWIGNNQDAVYGACFGASLTVYWTVDSIYGYRVNVYEEQEIVTTLDEKYIPDTIARTADIPPLDGLVTEERVTELINEALGVIENGTY